MERINLKKALLIVAAVLVAGAGITGIIYYFTTTQSVAVTVHDGVTVDIYPAKSDKGTDYEGNRVSSTDATKSVRLRENRSYVAVSRANNDYAETRKRFGVETKKATVELKPNFSDQKLASLLTAEKAAIDKAIVGISPALNTLYRVAEGKLYAQGEWYGTTLAYKGSDQLVNDTLRLIAHKENGTWTIIAKPQITQSVATHKNIPLEIVQAVNSLK